MNSFWPIRVIEAIAQRAPILVANMNTGVIIWASKRIHEIFGYQCVNDLEGMSVEQLVPEDHREAHVAYRESFNQVPTPRLMGQDREMMGRKRDGSTFPIQIELDSEKIGDDRLAFLVIIDLSESKLKK